MKVSPDPGADRPTDFVTVLNLVLADECLVYTKTRNYCGNVASPQFQEFHVLFEKQYDELSGIIDEISERIRALGGQAMSTMSEFLQHTQLEEHPVGHPSPARMIGHLLDDHQAVIRSLRGDMAACTGEVDDAGIQDFLASLIEGHERMEQTLRAHLENS